MKKVLIAVVLLLILGAGGAAAFWWLTEQRVTEFAKTPFGGSALVTVEIPPGTNPKTLSHLLGDYRVVADGDLLYRYLRREKLGPKLKAGEYEFTGQLTPVQVIEKIIKGDVKQYHFTVPEGLRADEILPIVAGSELKLSLEKLKKLAGTPAFVRKAGVPADSIEGFLYPDTYSFPRGATEETVLNKMISRTLEEAKKAPRAPGVDFSLLETITLASIIEKETGVPEERPRISCVFHNRMDKTKGKVVDYRLQTDPTVIYAKMLITGQYSKNITRADLLAKHPYNTYTTRGLPPGPIASPGGKAIQAALKPLECEDLFFCSKNDGTHIFCPTLECHEKVVDQYQRGGKKKQPSDGDTDDTGP